MELKLPASDDEGRGPAPEARTTGWYGVPRVPKWYVQRPRLLQFLDGAGSCPLVLVSAPAGSGKTSLVADWVRRRKENHPTVWVTFESDDEAFWPGVLGALARLGVAVPSKAFPSGSSVLDRRKLTALSAAVAERSASLTLVVDGYELVSSEIARDLDFVLRHTGHRLQLVLVTRVDPVLPLYRYRLEGTLAEVRMADLAFTDAEAAALLGAADVTITTDSIRALNRRTKGWVTGLRFASTFLSKSDDPDRAVLDVAGDRGNIAEYLMGEVLAAQTPEVRDLLLSTSIPETLQPGLTEALGGRSAARTLAFLTRVNAFVEPVPEHPGFYRYHPFFRDMLRAELAYEAPDQMERLQRRAAEWFAREGLLASSVRHYAAIDAWTEAAGQVVDGLAVGELLLDGSDNALSTTLRPIPDEVQDPAVSIVRASMALVDGDTDRFSEELAQVPEPLEQESDRHARAVSLAAAVLRAVRARYSADPGEAIELAEVAKRQLRQVGQQHTMAQSHPELVALVCASKGIATLRRGRLRAAQDIFTAGAGAATKPGSEVLLVECLGYLALIACVRHELTRARSLATRAVAIADELGIPFSDRPAVAQVALAWVDVEQYELRHAIEHIKLADDSDFISGDPVARTLLVIARSRLLVARGDVAGALTAVDRATAGWLDQGSWLVERLRLEAGHLRIVAKEPARAVLEVEGLGDRLPAEVALVVAQARLQKGDDEGVREALSRVLVPDAPAGARVHGWLIESTRQLQRGATTRGRLALDRALRIAARETLRRPFREAPAPVAQVLAGKRVPRPPESAWLNLPSQRSGTHEPASTMTQAQRPPLTVDDPPLVIGHLTEKELEVLGYLAQLLTTQEIANTMFVTVNTIRTHVRSILRKLGVTRRNAAIRRARELQLLPA